MSKSTRDSLVEENFNFAIRISSYYQNLVPDEGDRESLAAESLLRAIETYNPSRGANLKTHITTCMKRNMLAAHRDANRSIRKPPNIFSLDQPIQSREGHHNYTLYDITPSKEKNPLDRIILNEDISRIKSAINNLPPILQDVITSRYIIDRPLSQLEFGKRYKRSQAWAAIQERNAIARCREALC